MLADSDAPAIKGALFDDSQQLSRLIAHSTSARATFIEKALGFASYLRAVS
jgi:hypothetical protein